MCNFTGEKLTRENVMCDLIKCDFFSGENFIITKSNVLFSQKKTRLYLNKKNTTSVHVLL